MDSPIYRAMVALNAAEYINPVEFEDVTSPSMRRKMEAQVRLVLEAIREPSDEMLQSGPASDPLIDPLKLPGEIARNGLAWRAMIGAALNQGVAQSAAQDERFEAEKAGENG